MNKIKRAIIMAAGFGNRMQPITLNTPKPLIKVNGKRMIDTIVEALYENGIFEIYVVVGYKKEQFYEHTLEYKIKHPIVVVLRKMGIYDKIKQIIGWERH